MLQPENKKRISGDFSPASDADYMKLSKRQLKIAVMEAIGISRANITKLTKAKKADIEKLLCTNKGFKENVVLTIKKAIAVTGVVPFDAETAEEYVKGTAPRALQRLLAIEKFDPRRLYDKKGVQLKPQDLPDDLALAIKSIEGPEFRPSPRGPARVIPKYKYVPEDKNVAVKELLKVLGYDITKGKRELLEQNIDADKSKSKTRIDFGRRPGEDGEVSEATQ